MPVEVDTLVRQAGVDVGIDPEDSLLDEVVKNMKAEHIVHVWQVGLLDSSQWKALGAPMGLGVAIRALVSASQAEEESQIGPPKTEPIRFSSGLTSRSSVAINRNDHTSSRVSSSFRSNNHHSLLNKHTPSHRMKDQSKEEQADGAQEEEEESEAAVPVTSPTKKCNGDCVATCFKDMMNTALPVDHSCFVMSKLFNQALLHSKSGADLKAHTMFVIELSVLASALFLGAAIELWGAFPLDAVSSGPDQDGGVPQGLAVAFNMTSSLLIISQLTCACGWIWSLRVICAVAPNKFHQYVVETRHFADLINSISVVGFALFSIDLFLLLTACSLAVTNNWVVNGIVLGIVLMLFFAGFMMVHKITSFLGRVAYHGLLLTDQNPDPSAPLCGQPEESHFQKKELMLHRIFERHSILNESKAMNAYSHSSSACPVISRDLQY
jgi:hypothetical protein